MTLLKPAGIALAMVLGTAASSMANAAEIDFTNGSCTTGCVFDPGNGQLITLTVTAETDGDTNTIKQNGQGLGIDSADYSIWVDDNALDNYNGAGGRDGTYERLVFTFTGNPLGVEIDSIELDNFEPTGNADKHAVLDWGNDGLGLINIDDNNMSNLGGSNWSYNANGQATTVFSIATPNRSDGFASFRINSIQVSAVPVPAAAYLFGSALLGLVGVSRRRKA